MGWQRVERASLGAAVVFSVASAVIGFRWVQSPYFRGYASAAGTCLVVGRLAGAMAGRATPAVPASS
jgi:hypothetical protein